MSWVSLRLLPNHLLAFGTQDRTNWAMIPAEGRRSANGVESVPNPAPVYGWFTEGFDPPDLKEAKALLDELR
jgi:hypothetical protein